MPGLLKLLEIEGLAKKADFEVQSATLVKETPDGASA
jgi:hypothetical protein